jgi:RNA polymerase sigma factor (sigma-70 family)
VDESDDFGDVMDRLRRGDDATLAELIRRYSDRLKALARARLQGRLAGQGEQSDVVQSMWVSFVRRQRAGEFDGVGGWDELWSLLARITACKCVDRVRYFAARRRREPEPEVGMPVERAAADPTPDEQAVYEELFVDFMGALTPRDRRIISLHLQGLVDEQISAEVGWSERTVARVRRQARESLEARLRA